MYGTAGWEGYFDSFLRQQLAASAVGGGVWQHGDEFPEEVLAEKEAQLRRSVPLLRDAAADAHPGGITSIGGCSGKSDSSSGDGHSGSSGSDTIMVAVHVSGSALPANPKSSLAVARATGRLLARSDGVLLTTGGFAGIGEATGRAMHEALGTAAAEGLAANEGGGAGELSAMARRWLARTRQCRAQRERIVHLLPERDLPQERVRVGGLQVNQVQNLSVIVSWC